MDNYKGMYQSFKISSGEVLLYRANILYDKPSDAFLQIWLIRCERFKCWSSVTPRSLTFVEALTDSGTNIEWLNHCRTSQSRREVKKKNSRQSFTTSVGTGSSEQDFDDIELTIWRTIVSDTSLKLTNECRQCSVFSIFKVQYRVAQITYLLYQRFSS